MRMQETAVCERCRERARVQEKRESARMKIGRAESGRETEEAEVGGGERMCVQGSGGVWMEELGA
jgi:hypothetical protein